MTSFLRGMAALLLAATACIAPGVLAQDKTVLTTDRDRISYMVGMDVSRSLASVGPDMDIAAFERALRNALGGGEPLFTEAEAAAVRPALMQRVAARSGRRMPGLAPGSVPPEVDKGKVGLMMGADAGRSLAQLADEIDVPVFMQGLRTGLADGTPLLSQEQMAQVGELLQAKMQSRAHRQAEDNRQAGLAFLEANKSAKGVFTTGSGLQYQVLKQGSGRRPSPTDTVRVQYRGTLLDGTVFDSSYERDSPAEFGLRQVIAGWMEGLMLMPIGARYRFWIPSELAYGQRGSPPNIGPNSTLAFDVELVDIL